MEGGRSGGVGGDVVLSDLADQGVADEDVVVRRRMIVPPLVESSLLHEMPSPSSDWTARQPHARGWLG